jgi:hypothetical protein
VKRVREQVDGVVRWDWALDDDELCTALLAVLHSLAALVDRDDVAEVTLTLAPGIGRCPICGAWGPPGACRTPHDTARAWTNRWQRNAPSNAIRPSGWTRGRERARAMPVDSATTHGDDMGTVGDSTTAPARQRRGRQPPIRASGKGAGVSLPERACARQASEVSR